jgi:adenine-specific DNA-methyltransferase
MTPPNEHAALADTTPPKPSEIIGDVDARAQRLRIATSPEHKKTWGQYFTPPELTSFMARLPQVSSGTRLRVLDPGAGTGALGLTLARELLQHRGVQSVELYCVESEPQARQELKSSIMAAQVALGSRFTATIYEQDFLDFATPRFGIPAIPPIDIAISNPPYFKMSPRDERGGDAPNIYARFMDVSARLLRTDGQLCFIVPRSYASGPYFTRFRRRFHHSMQLEHVHVFESRTAAFKTDKVLQENVIVLYSKRAPAPTEMVTLSASDGIADLTQRRTFTCMRQDLISDNDDAVVSLPTTSAHVNLMKRFRALPNTLQSLELQISTGPVVPFRAVEFLVDEDCPEPTAPLLWLQHVRRSRVTWPIGPQFRKQEHVRLCAGGKLLVPAANYVLLRRFSAKEEDRRLTAAPLLAKHFDAEHLGIENHVNYIHRPAGGMSDDEARGLSVLLNSRILDDYFRVSSGNTQVSATEIRALPLPSRQFIETLGRMATSKSYEDEQAEQMIGEMLDATSG